MSKNNDIKKEEVTDQKSKSQERREEIMKEAEPKEKESVRVTSTKTIDFPGINWGINAGAERELPADEEAQKIILNNENITIIK